MKNILLVLLFIVAGCTNKNETPPIIQQICSSEFCSENGAKELINLYEDDNMTNETMTFKINCIVATNKKVDFNFQKKIKNLNKVFIKGKIKFIVHSEISISPQKLTIDQIAEKEGIFTQFKQNLKKEKSINIIIVPHGKSLNGFTLVLPEKFLNYLNLGYETIYISDKAWFNTSTLQHELGHFFGLQHTFGELIKENSTLEKPNGTNCKEEGDFIRDTPSDPNGKSDAYCNYVKKIKKNGKIYSPKVNNYMSYYPNKCKNEFTKGQYKAMNLFAKEYRSYLIY